MKTSSSREKLFKDIFFETRHQLYGFLLGILRDESKVQDCMQQCYMKLWEVLETIDTTKAVLPLLYTYSRNLAIDQLRKNARYVWVDNLSVLLEQMNEPTVENDLLQKEHANTLHTLLQQMPPHRRKVFILVKINGFSYKEAAAHLNIALSTVEKHMHEAHKFLAGLERPVSL